VKLPELIAMLSTKPARILSLDRGALSPGAAADVTIFSLDQEWTYDVNRSPSKSRNSPFHGHHFRGGPIATIVSGQIVWRFEE
jgi:dihydroorotase